LAAVGELSALEQERLRHHLAECPRCAEMYEAFANVASNDLGVVAADRESGETVANSSSDVQETRRELHRLRTRLKLTQDHVSGESGPPEISAERNEATRKHLWTSAVYRRVAYAIAATILLSVTVAGGIALWRSERATSTELARSHDLERLVDSLKQNKAAEGIASHDAVVRSLDESQKARDVLAKSFAASEGEKKELLAREKASEEKLAEAIVTSEQLRSQLDAKDADRERLAKLQQDSEAKLHEALAELYQARQNVQTAAKDEIREASTLEAVAQPASESGPTGISPSESEARSLFGARDLHIVDVYDVTGDGQTKRTYGRVYYVEKRLLVFYAFDLQNRQDHKRGVFQAWGYREANGGKALDLGLFAVDDTPSSRWVLTVNRPDVLSHIDAVFVTVEPPGGSKAPRGKKVLYANLAWPPNHP
jgi:hypothetical protein